jgi:hypothetical protein
MKDSKIDPSGSLSSSIAIHFFHFHKQTTMSQLQQNYGEEVNITTLPFRLFLGV